MPAPVSSSRSTIDSFDVLFLAKLLLHSTLNEAHISLAFVLFAVVSVESSFSLSTRYLFRLGDCRIVIIGFRDKYRYLRRSLCRRFTGLEILN